MDISDASSKIYWELLKRLSIDFTTDTSKYLKNHEIFSTSTTLPFQATKCTHLNQIPVLVEVTSLAETRFQKKSHKNTK